MIKRQIAVNDLMQTGYVYFCTEPVGKNFHLDFHPELTPQEMLELGVFGGKYMTDTRPEFPAAWFKNARFSSDRHDPSSTALALTRRNHCRFGEKTAGFITKIPAAGFSGIAATILGRAVSR